MPLKTRAASPLGVPGCPHCAARRPFKFPDPVVEALLGQNLVLFAGAGVSTEGQRVFNTTLAREFAVELNLPNPDRLSFPQVMDAACERLGRPAVLRRIKHRVDYLRSFPEVYRDAARFHRELATIPFLEEIFTTNWDDLFERECGATAIISADDFVFWELPGRKVFKIHGSVANWGSLILTTADYERSYSWLASSLIGSRLKLALATKTVLFCGYSLTDADFVRLLEIVKGDMGSAQPAAYAVTLDESQADQYAAMGVTPIITNATYFLETIKKRLVADKIMLSDSRFADLLNVLDRVSREHRRLYSRFQCSRNPETIFAASYQDGLQHACEHVLSMAHSGVYSHPCHIVAKVKAYEEIRKEKLRDGIYEDVAYIDGYANGLAYVLMPRDAQQRLPLYYAFGAREDLRTLFEYARATRKAETLHKAAFKRARELVNELPNGGRNIEFHHVAFL